MTPRFPLKRSTSVDTIETVSSHDSSDFDFNFVDRVCSKVKKAASSMKETRGRIILSAMLRPGSEQNLKSEKCEQSIFSIDTLDIDDQIEAIIEAEIQQQEQHDYNECKDKYDEQEEMFEEESQYSDGASYDKSEVVAKRRVNSRIRYDSKCRRREHERRSARETAAALVREKKLQRKTQHGGSNRRIQHRQLDSRQHRRGRIVYEVVQ